MATWKPSPSVSSQAAGGDSPGTGKFPYGQNLGQVLQQSPSPPWLPAPSGAYLTNQTRGSPL